MYVNSIDKAGICTVGTERIEWEREKERDGVRRKIETERCREK